MKAHARLSLNLIVYINHISVEKAITYDGVHITHRDDNVNYSVSWLLLQALSNLAYIYYGNTFESLGSCGSCCGCNVKFRVFFS